MGKTDLSLLFPLFTSTPCRLLPGALFLRTLPLLRPANHRSLFVAKDGGLVPLGD